MMDDDDDIDVNAAIAEKPLTPNNEPTIEDDHLEEEAEVIPVEHISVSPKDMISVGQLQERRTDYSPSEPKRSIQGSPTQAESAQFEKQFSLADTKSNPSKGIDSESEQKTPRKNTTLPLKDFEVVKEPEKSPKVTPPTPKVEQPAPRPPRMQTLKPPEQPPAFQARSSLNLAAKRQSIPKEIVSGPVTPKVSKPMVQYCKKHKDKPLEVVCMTDRVVICSSCALFDGHHGHQFRETAEVQKEIEERAFK